MCLSVCLSVRLFLRDGQFWAEIGIGNFEHEIWHAASLYSRIIIGVSERRLSPRARAPRAVHTPLQMSGELRREIRN